MALRGDFQVSHGFFPCGNCSSADVSQPQSNDTAISATLVSPFRNRRRTAPSAASCQSCDHPSLQCGAEHCLCSIPHCSVCASLLSQRPEPIFTIWRPT
ncbi:hypothetical protein JL2886_00098 [Phaeobacter gallaeciensis]|uniref:Uncharacterized protein n=1 Tax=Phaeobacter gallaeciensis TaxID=60890 RepID=A0A1B0ZLK8_9RHOB|nr:hypothetical protein JL2886_00098 [Phaeobacter gallaeciensis]